jgi:signal transduction histidine kinase
MIPADEIRRLFQPFQRLNGVRTRHKDGHGLGLSIVEAVALAHHATLTANAQPKGGLTVEVSFPRLPHPSAVSTHAEPEIAAYELR